MGWGKKDKPQFSGATVGQLVTGTGSDTGKAGHVVAIEGRDNDTEFVLDTGQKIHIDNVRNVTR